MTTFEETLHPRAGDGTFAEKPRSGAEVTLAPAALPLHDLDATLALVLADETLLDHPSWDTADLTTFESFNAAATAAGHFRLRQSLAFAFEGDDHEAEVSYGYDRRGARTLAAAAFSDQYDEELLELVGVFREHDDMDQARFVTGSGDARRARAILDEG